MTATRLNRAWYWLLALVLLIFVTDTLIARATTFATEDPVLVYAILFDFMIVIPVLYWAIVLRPQKRSIVKVAPLPIAGAAAAWIALPASLRGAVWQAAWPLEAALIAVEITIIGYEIRVVYRFIQRFRRVRKHEPDTVEALRIAVHEGIGRGKLASLLLHDLTMLYALIFSWGKRRLALAEASALRFTYHRKTNQTLYAAIITKILLIEGISVHLLLQQWSHWAAWILTAADLWLLALLWADSRMSFLQPVRIDGVNLTLRYGLRIQADVPLSAISGAVHATEFHPDSQELRESAVPLLATPNVRIDLARPVQIGTLLFFPRKVTRIYLAMDDPQHFVRAIREGLH